MTDIDWLRPFPVARTGLFYTSFVSNNPGTNALGDLYYSVAADASTTQSDRPSTALTVERAAKQDVTRTTWL